MKPTELRTLIKESIQEYIKDIDEAGSRAALEAKITKTQEAIDKRTKLTSKDGLDEAYHEFLDERKMKEMTSEIKLLEKSIAKYKNQLEKMDEKKTPKSMEDKGMKDEGIVDEVTIDPPAGAQLEEDQLDEAKKKPSAGMTKKEKSALSKKAHAGKDIGKKGKGFEKVAKAGEKQYGSKEAGEKVAAAAMWKAAAKKESVETEGEVLNEQFLHMQKLAGLITEAEYQKKKMLNEAEDIVSFLNKNMGEFIKKVGDPRSKFKTIGDPLVATAGTSDSSGIDVSFNKEHMLKLFPEGDPHNEVQSANIAGKVIYYNDYL